MCDAGHVQLAHLSGATITELLDDIDNYYTGSLQLDHIRCQVDEGVPVCRKIDYLYLTYFLLVASLHRSRNGNIQPLWGRRV